MALIEDPSVGPVSQYGFPLKPDLPARNRRIFMFTLTEEGQEMTYAEIAKNFDVSKNTVAMAVRDGRAGKWPDVLSAHLTG